MSSMQKLLNDRFLPQEKHSSKVKELAEQSSDGNRSSFSGLFQVAPLTKKEADTLELLLTTYAGVSTNFERDLEKLKTLTSEVKAIHKQAALLHGERISSAQKLFSMYQEGAFTQWLMNAYGNRQTPYNFLHYYLFYQTLSEGLKTKVKDIPQQAIYVLASRNASQKEKEAIVAGYSGQTKAEMLNLIQTAFPLAKNDKRKADHGQKILLLLESLCLEFQKNRSFIKQDKARQIEKTLTKFLAFAESRSSF